MVQGLWVYELWTSGFRTLGFRTASLGFEFKLSGLRFRSLMAPQQFLVMCQDLAFQAVRCGHSWL